MCSAARLWGTTLTVGLACGLVGLVGPSQPAAMAEEAAAKPDAAPSETQPQFTPEQIEFFEKKVRPVLAQHCQDCHGADFPEAGLAMISRAAILAGGESGPAVKLDAPDQSLLLQAIRYDGALQMPPEGKLPPEAVAALTAWVKGGLPWPEEKVAPGAAVKHNWAPATPEAIAEARKSHWSFQPVEQPPVPEVGPSEWPISEVDHFVLARLQTAGLEPSAPADRRTLIRRASFDLHGLPPSPDDVAEFLADPRPTPQAFAALVDRLLDEPEYGQRWGRHWLDVARYADTKGYVFQEERKYPFSYTYRDYVIDSLNDDKPYDQFVKEQIAADQLELGEEKSGLAAMGFLTLGRRFLNNQHDIIDDRIDVTTRGFLGLTVSCARCHDHKFDPIPTADYYSLYGVFASSTEPEELPLLGPPPETAGYERYAERLAQLQGDVDAYLKSEHDKMQREVRHRVGDYLLAVYRWPEAQKQGANLRNYCLEHKLIQRTFERWQRRLDKEEMSQNSLFGPWHRFAALTAGEYPEFVTELQSPDAREKYNPLVLQALTEQPPKSLDEVAKRYNTVFAKVEDAWATLRKQNPDAQALPEPAAEALRQAIYGETAPTMIALAETEGLLQRDQRNQLRNRRRKLDQFKATSPDAPPRGMVLVDKPAPVEPAIFRRGNPGNRGDRIPRQFLAVLDGPERQPFSQGSGRRELAEAIASRDNPLTARVMVNRVWMWHFGEGLVRSPSDFGTQGEQPSHPELLDYLASRFMEEGWSLKQLHRRIMNSRTYQQASDIRPQPQAQDPDNYLLWRMNRQRLDFEALRDAVLEVAGRLDRSLGGRAVEITQAPFPTRRTVYAFIERQNLPGVFRTFDLASPDSSTPQRYVTTVPQQALFMMNSPFVIEQAEHFAGRPEVVEQTDPAERIRRMYQLAYGRDPSPDEFNLALAFVSSTVAAQTPADDAMWLYGYGRFDESRGTIAKFELLPYFSGDTWQGGPQRPDPKLGWAMLTRGGGHVGNDQDHAVMRRWRAPAAGKVSMAATLEHSRPEGDGVRARLVSNRQGLLGEWTAHNAKTATNVNDLTVEAGELLYFVTDCRGSVSHDSFAWSPVVTLTPNNGAAQQFSAAAGFSGDDQPRSESLTRWQQFAQVLLMSNEFAYVD